MIRRFHLSAGAAAITVAAVSVGRAAAQDGDGGGDGGVTIIDLGEVADKLGELVDLLSDFTGSFSETVTDILFSVFWQPFLDVLHAAVQFLVFLLAWMPPTTMPEILAVHRDVYLISTGLAGLGFTAVGLAYIGYGPAGLSYQKLRPAIPKLVAALVFGGLAPWLLAPIVDLSEAIALALAPRDPDTTAMLMMTAELVVVAWLQSIVLLAVLVVLAMTKIYVVFGVAATPLLAVLWAVPFKYTQGKADALIGIWWACLLVGPFDMIVFRLSLALLSLDGFDAASWILGLAGTGLMLGLPYMLVQSGVAAAAPAMAAARSATQKAADVEISDTTREEMRQMAGDVQDDVASMLPSREKEDDEGNRFNKDAILDQGDDDE